MESSHVQEHVIGKQRGAWMKQRLMETCQESSEVVDQAIDQ